jgi:acyl carrier protein
LLRALTIYEPGEVSVDQKAITEKLQEIFETVMDIDFEITPALTAKDVAEWDSLTHVRLIVTIEKAFKMRFSAAEVGELKNVGDLIALIEKHVN